MMAWTKLLFLGSIFFSFLNSISQEAPEFTEKPELNKILESAKVNGSILIYDYIDNEMMSNDFKWAEKGHLPASTFKIPNSIIALETGVVESDTSILKWDGTPRRIPVWEKDMDIKEAFRLSCVPCYQKIAREIGVERMKEYLKKLAYPGMKVDKDNVDVFWLEGKSKINQYQQIYFLQKLYFGELPVNNKTTQIIKSIMILEDGKNYRLSAKTGWAIRDGNNIGWFVGYLESNNKVYFFVTNIQPEEDFNIDMFNMIRQEVTMEAFRKLKLIK